jgi:hypothetical protein
MDMNQEIFSRHSEDKIGPQLVKLVQDFICTAESIQASDPAHKSYDTAIGLQLVDIITLLRPDHSHYFQIAPAIAVLSKWIEDNK